MSFLNNNTAWRKFYVISEVPSSTSTAIIATAEVGSPSTIIPPPQPSTQHVDVPSGNEMTSLPLGATPDFNQVFADASELIKLICGLSTLS